MFTLSNVWTFSETVSIDCFVFVLCVSHTDLFHFMSHIFCNNMAPHSSTLAWKIPWAEEPGRLQSMGSWRVGHDWGISLSLFTFMHWRRKWQPTPVFLPGESQGRGSLVGCRLWGRTESDTTEATWQQHVMISEIKSSFRINYYCYLNILKSLINNIFPIFLYSLFFGQIFVGYNL